MNGPSIRTMTRKASRPSPRSAGRISRAVDRQACLPATALANEHDRRAANIGRALQFPIAEFRGEARRGAIFGIDDAGRSVRAEMRIAPGQRRADSLRGITLAMHGGGENP